MGTQGETLVASDYQEAFACSYRTYFTRVFAYIYNRVSDVEVAKDLTAEVFEKAYAKGHGLREQQAYAAWLFMIARNTVAGYFRQQKRQQRHLERMKQSLLGLKLPEELAQGAIRQETLAKALVRLLSEREQELLALKFDAGLTNDEIARVMGMSRVNVRVSVFRALAKLRDRLKEIAD